MVSRLRSVSILQFAIVFALLYAFVGLIVGIIWWLAIGPIMMAGVKAGGGGAMPGAGAMAGVGVLAVIFGPIFYGAIGFIGGLIWAALYNLVAGWTGGIEFRLEGVAVSESIATV